MAHYIFKKNKNQRRSQAELINNVPRIQQTPADNRSAAILQRKLAKEIDETQQNRALAGDLNQGQDLIIQRVQYLWMLEPTGNSEFDQKILRAREHKELTGENFLPDEEEETTSDEKKEVAEKMQVTEKEAMQEEDVILESSFPNSLKKYLTNEDYKVFCERWEKNEEGRLIGFKGMMLSDFREKLAFLKSQPSKVEVLPPMERLMEKWPDCNQHLLVKLEGLEGDALVEQLRVNFITSVTYDYKKQAINGLLEGASSGDCGALTNAFYSIANELCPDAKVDMKFISGPFTIPEAKCLGGDTYNEIDEKDNKVWKFNNHYILVLGSAEYDICFNRPFDEKIISKD